MDLQPTKVMLTRALLSRNRPAFVMYSLTSFFIKVKFSLTVPPMSSRHVRYGTILDYNLGRTIGMAGYFGTFSV